MKSIEAFALIVVQVSENAQQIQEELDDVHVEVQSSKDVFFG